MRNQTKARSRQETSSSRQEAAATIGLISCYKGFNCGQGAQGVGRACTEAFVSGFVVILILDFFLALLLKSFYEAVWGFKVVF